jgi:PAS domain S-box-containing protein
MITQTNVILDSIADGVFTIDREWKITSFNQAAEKITGVSRKDALGSTCRDVFHSNLCDARCVLKESIETNQPITNRSVYIINAFGEQVPISISAAPLKDSQGNIIGGVETFRDVTEVVELKKQLYQQYSFQDIISKSKSMQKLFAILPDIAQSNSTVLIQGESGTGKELFAQAIHNLSSRAKGPFVVVNSGALPDTLLESELFGYKAGAFTDAKRDKPGRFALAEGGTLFLDEIGDISPALQVRLLRVLQQKTYEPLGSTQSMRADVRIITATHRRLPELVREGTFREDLYYRLNVVPLHLTPLRERREDIPLLVHHFINRFNRLNHREITIDESALAILMQHHFPGNVRELENIIEYAFILCRGERIIWQHLPDDLQPQFPQFPIQAGLTLKAIEKQAVLLALERNQWKRLRTANELGIDKGTLRRIIEKNKLEPPEE